MFWEQTHNNLLTEPNDWLSLTKYSRINVSYFVLNISCKACACTPLNSMCKISWLDANCLCWFTLHKCISLQGSKGGGSKKQNLCRQQVGFLFFNCNWTPLLGLGFCFQRSGTMKVRKCEKKEQPSWWFYKLDNRLFYMEYM